MEFNSYNANTPKWREISVGSYLPEKLKNLSEIAHNLWWSWHDEAQELFSVIDTELWNQTRHNPVLLLEKTSHERLEELSEDENYIEKMNSVYASFRRYIDTETNHSRPSVAYFSMEYGLDQALKIYSGGLGILAGDYLKEASDSNVDLCAVGLLYRYGYFDQTLSMDGQQIADYEAQNFGHLPIEKVTTEEGKQLVIHVPYADSFTVHANVWQVNVGRIKLYLLDTDNELNSEYDRPITHHLYGGDWENRLKQEILLGIGGMMMLDELGIKKDIYHCNEGHAALINIYRLCKYIKEGLSFNEAMELVRSSSLYTVHTPVPAGHDYFEEQLFYKYMKGYTDKLGISWKELMDLGRQNPGDKNERFCMSVFACKTCQEVNGVSKLHQEVSQKMFAPIWKGYFPEENHVGYVTNGVHFSTWCAKEWKELFKEYFDEKFISNLSDESYWKNIYNVPDEKVWFLRQHMKNKLADFLKKKCTEDWLNSQANPSLGISTFSKFSSNALMIGFGRRFATYKRAHLLFTDLDRLSKIVNDPQKPVVFIFAGKAHPNDGPGKDLIKQIVEISRRPEFLGKILFVENYDMELARKLVSCVDIWMNTPTRLAEASGTSGEKALMNGVLNFSVLDGWWYEGYKKEAGWAIPAESVYQNNEYQDKLDAELIYYTLENEILPLYYERHGKDFSEGWIKYIKNSIANIAPHYTMKRQLDDYYDRFYNKLEKRFKVLSENNYAKAKYITTWKKEIASKWNDIEIKSIDTGNGLNATIKAGEEYDITIVIDEKGLDDAIGVESVITHIQNGNERIYSVIPLELISRNGNLYTFKGKSCISNAGSFKQSFRMYPKNKLLPHRQDFCYVRWF